MIAPASSIAPSAMTALGETIAAGWTTLPNEAPRPASMSMMRRRRAFAPHATTNVAPSAIAGPATASSSPSGGQSSTAAGPSPAIAAKPATATPREAGRLIHDGGMLAARPRHDDQRHLASASCPHPTMLLLGLAAKAGRTATRWRRRARAQPATGIDVLHEVQGQQIGRAVEAPAGIGLGQRAQFGQLSRPASSRAIRWFDISHWDSTKSGRAVGHDFICSNSASGITRSSGSSSRHCRSEN